MICDICLFAKNQNEPECYCVEVEGVMSSVSDSRCGACGEPVETPLLAMIISKSTTEKYYACPKCLSKITNISKEPEMKEALEIDVDENTLKNEIAEPERLQVSTEGNVEGPKSCLHFLGYLKQRPKDKPIPEECLTCSNMIDCMY
jgi:DNA-directed RNA polymerase subunit RPC12/RpoP